MFGKIINVLIVILIGGVLGGGILLFAEMATYASDRQTYDELQEKAVKSDALDSTNKKIDFDYLSIVNPGTCSWITIPNTEIDYPIVQGEDNKFYLDHDINGEASRAGAIFLDYECAADLSDIKTIIYGHNMKDGSMFHDLHKFRKEVSFGIENPYMYLYMDNDYIAQYELLCTISTVNSDKAVYGYVMDNQTAADVAQAIIDKADNVYAEVRGTNIIVLSTCIKGQKRFDVVYQYIPGIMNSISDSVNN